MGSIGQAPREAGFSVQAVELTDLAVRMAGHDAGMTGYVVGLTELAVGMTVQVGKKACLAEGMVDQVG